MTKLIGFQRAVQLSLVLFGLISLFHLGVIIGILAFDFAPVDFLWGGQMSTKEELLSFEIVSLVVMVVCILVVLIRSQRIKLSALIGLSRVILWILFVLFLLNTVGNALAKTNFERSFTVVTLLLAFLCLRMAIEKPNRNES